MGIPQSKRATLDICCYFYLVATLIYASLLKGGAALAEL